MSAEALTSIAQVDTYIQDCLTSPFLTAFEQRFSERSAIHRQLLALKWLYGKHPAVNKGYEERRSRQLQTRAAPPQRYMDGYMRVLGEISQAQGDVFGNNHVHHFLDLGFSPGGFSTWLLENNPQATGVGITSPSGEAGYVYIPTPILSSNRYSPHFHNIISLTTQALRDGKTPISSLLADNGNDISHPHFDFIIAGAFPTLEGRIPWHQRTRLTLSQFYIILTHLERNGSALFLVNTKPFRWQVEMIGILRACFISVVGSKGSLHKTRTSCYLVCTGFHASPAEISAYAGKLESALMRLEDIAARAERETALDSEEGEAKDADPETEFPSILGRSDDEIFNSEYQGVLQLFEHLWEFQFNAIRDEFKIVLEREAQSSAIARSYCYRSNRPYAYTPSKGNQSHSVQTRRFNSYSTCGFTTTGNSNENWRRVSN